MGKPQWPRGRRDRRCEECDKSSFPTLSAALSISTNAIKGQQLYGYECPHGNGWHLTRRWQPMIGKDVVW